MEEYYIVRQPLPFGGMFGPFQGPGFPPGQGPGFPGQGPGFPPGGGPGPGFPGQVPGGGPGMGPPTGRPPSFIPQQATAFQATQLQPGVFAIDPGAIRPCRFRFVYIWLNNGQQFWAWLVFVGAQSVSGWRWTGFNWVFFGVDLNRISSFICY